MAVIAESYTDYRRPPAGDSSVRGNLIISASRNKVTRGKGNSRKKVREVLLWQGRFGKRAFSV